MFSVSIKSLSTGLNSRLASSPASNEFSPDCTVCYSPRI